jgi:four helix bundle suffix protein
MTPEQKTKGTSRTAGKNRPLKPGFIPPHGGYKNLLSYQKAEIVYDATVYFCGRFLEKRDRTYDQMIQSARSGKQNIIEGSMASATSKETEIKLTNVARASLEELLADYRDFLRTRKLEEWTKDHRYTKRLRELNRQPGADYQTFRRGIEHPDPAISANVIIGLIKVSTYLLNQQLRQLEQAFLKEGGLRERMTRARLAMRSQQGPPKEPKLVPVLEGPSGRFGPWVAAPGGELYRTNVR